MAKGKGKEIEAYGVKGMASTSWRKIFKSPEALIAWAEKNDATVYASRDAADSRGSYKVGRVS